MQAFSHITLPGESCIPWLQPRSSRLHYQLVLEFYPSLDVPFHSGVLVSQVTVPGDKSGAPVLPQGTADARSWAAQLHTSVKHPTAAKNSKHSSTKCRDAKGTSCHFFFSILKQIIGVYSDVPKTYRMPGRIIQIS